MLMVISPAKMLDFSAPPPGAPLTTPTFGEDTAILAKAARRLTGPDLKRLMGISDALARLNRARFQAFDAASEDGVQAVFAFNGDVYRGLGARRSTATRCAGQRDIYAFFRGSTACCARSTPSSPIGSRWALG